MSFQKSPIRLLILVIGLFTLSACGDNSSNSQPATTTSVIELPSAVLTLPSGGQLRAYITLDNDINTRTEMAIIANTATASFTISRDPHTVLIEFKYTDSAGVTVTVASASQIVDLSSGDVSLSFVDTDYDLDSYDDDGDGISNAAELSAGTVPYTIIDIEGLWTITEISKTSNCALPAPAYIYDLTVTQNGS
ncbi:MAG: hypothetical protein KJO91_09215, partial [Gammaproteobacteria bacterium]|nr:hypothetical protein [Gammaproteobacteria bacterium]